MVSIDLPIKKKINISIVQGRLSSSVGTKYQHFPIHAWRDEFALAAALGFDGIEWIISDLSNPIFDSGAQEEIKRLTKSNRVSISSISLDLLMTDPIHNQSRRDIRWLFDRVVDATACLGVRRVSVPVEENSGIRSEKDAEMLVDVLSFVLNEYGSRIPLLSIETDLSPHNVAAVLNRDELKGLGLLIDIGNIAANGFRFEDYFQLCGKYIYAFHVKDRRPMYGQTCPLGEGSAQIEYALRCRHELPMLADITLQTYRSDDCYLEDARSSLAFIRKTLEATK